jgi:hypothetical protein
MRPALEAAALALVLLGWPAAARADDTRGTDPSSTSKDAALPAGVRAMLPGLADAERRLQDSTLDLEAARRDAAPAQRDVDSARAAAESGSWLARWRLERDLARLKVKLDGVESARVSQAGARQNEFTLLSGVEEELRGSLEAACSRPGAAPAPAVLELWWEREQAWSRRVEALEASGPEVGDSVGRDEGGILVETRLQELDRDEALLESLRKRGVLSAAAAREQRSILQEDRRRLKSRLAGSGRKI